MVHVGTQHMTSKGSRIELLLSFYELVWMSSRDGQREIAAPDQIIQFRVEVIVTQLIHSWTNPSGQRIRPCIRLVGKGVVTQQRIRLPEWQRLTEDVAKARGGNAVIECCRCVLAIPFVGEKEKGFITFDRPSQRAAKLVPYRVGFPAEDRLTGRQRRAFVTMKQTTMPFVRSRFCGHIQISTQAPVLRREHTLDDLHFADP